MIIDGHFDYADFIYYGLQRCRSSGAMPVMD
jgi:hypothetical protein